jgi:drug/metabolite transporter (DMT)-like permease
MAFVAQRIGMEFIGPFLFTGIRMLLGALTLLIVLGVSDCFRGFQRRGKQVLGERDAQSTDASEAVAAPRELIAPGAVAAPQEVIAPGAVAVSKEVIAPEAPIASRSIWRLDDKAARNGWGRYVSLLKAGIACGLPIFLASCFQQVGLVFTTASKAGFLTALYIVLVPVIGVALRQKTHWNTWVSVLIAAVGLYLLCMTGGFSLSLGDALTLIGAFFWACHILVIDHFVEGLSRRDIMKLCVAQFVIAALVSLIAAPFLDRLFVARALDIQNLTDALPALLYAGVLSTGIAFTLQAIGQQGLSPSAASLVMSLEAVFSVVGGMLILGETLSGRELFGCVAMFAAVILSQLSVGQSHASKGSSP